VVLPFIVEAGTPCGLTLWRPGAGYWSWTAFRWVQMFDVTQCIRRLEPTPGAPGDDVCAVLIPEAARLDDVVVQVVALLADGELSTVRVDAFGT
jgi:hypothetical protein